MWIVVKRFWLILMDFDEFSWFCEIYPSSICIEINCFFRTIHALPVSPTPALRVKQNLTRNPEHSGLDPDSSGFARGLLPLGERRPARKNPSILGETEPDKKS